MAITEQFSKRAKFFREFFKEPKDIRFNFETNEFESKFKGQKIESFDQFAASIDAQAMTEKWQKFNEMLDAPN